MTNLFRDAVIESQRDRLYGEVLLRQSLSTRLVTASVFVIVVMVSFFVAIGHYSRIEPARGVLVPAGQSSKIYALRPGVISALLVEDGTLVTPGQKLAVITSDQPSGDGNRYTEDGVAALGAQQELARERITLAGTRSNAERNRLQATLGGLSRQRDNLSTQLGLQREIVASSRAMFEQLGPVAAKGFVSKLEVERRRQAYLNSQQQAAQLSTQLTGIETQIAQAQADLMRIPTDESGQIVDAKTALEGFRQQKSRLEAEHDYSITAPIGGRVTALQATAGKTVGGPLPLMTIIPENVTLEADVYVASRAIGFIKPYQEVRLLYDAFPYQRFGSFKGIITSVSRVIIAPNELDAPLKVEEPVYKVRVALHAQSVSAFGEYIPVQPGMTLTANVVLERQSFWEWLTAPLRAVVNRS